MRLWLYFQGKFTWVYVYSDAFSRLINCLLAYFNNRHSYPAIRTDSFSTKWSLEFEVEIVDVIGFIEESAFQRII